MSWRQRLRYWWLVHVEGYRDGPAYFTLTRRIDGRDVNILFTTVDKERGIIGEAVFESEAEAQKQASAMGQCWYVRRSEKGNGYWICR